jgi:cardiolipin synthase A/B
MNLMQEGWVAAALVLVYASLAVAAAGHALLNKRDPRAAWAWIAVCWLFPLAGALLYYLFGINRIHREARRVIGPAPGPHQAATRHSAELPELPGVTREGLLELVRIGESMTGRPLIAGNRVEPLHNGEEAYPAMLEAIAQARHSIWLATYIFESGDIGRQFAEALAAAQARGVRVRALIDGVGDLYYFPPGSALLRKRGVTVRRFLPPRLFPPMLHINLRNHRKLLSVDGRTAFVGGMNIGDYHLPASLERNATIDLHFRIEGPVVTQLDEVFAGDWRDAGGEDLPLAVPSGAASGPALCRALTDGPNEDLDKLVLVLLGALATAHRHVRIMTPYFLPPAELVGALQSAALRGVRVDIILPQRSNLPWVDWACRHSLAWLLGREVRVWLRPAPFAHSKMFLVDDYYAQIGSANLDPRSLRLNFELMLEVFDTALVRRLGAEFDEVRAACRALGVKELASRGLPARLRDAFFWLFSPYL